LALNRFGIKREGGSPIMRQDPMEQSLLRDKSGRVRANTNIDHFLTNENCSASKRKPPKDFGWVVGGPIIRRCRGSVCGCLTNFRQAMKKPQTIGFACGVRNWIGQLSLLPSALLP
jgi:hypothetical protein